MTIPASVRDMCIEQFMKRQLPDPIRYRADIRVKAGTTPVSQELFIEGEPGRRLYLPNDSYLAGYCSAGQWNINSRDFRQDLGFVLLKNINSTLTVARTNTANQNNPAGGTVIVTFTGTNEGAFRYLKVQILNIHQAANTNYMASCTIFGLDYRAVGDFVTANNGDLQTIVY